VNNRAGKQNRRAKDEQDFQKTHSDPSYDVCLLKWIATSPEIGSKRLVQSGRKTKRKKVDVQRKRVGGWNPNQNAAVLFALEGAGSMDLGGSEILVADTSRQLGS
jgi:hypothetical protein